MERVSAGWLACLQPASRTAADISPMVRLAVNKRVRGRLFRVSGVDSVNWSVFMDSTVLTG